MTRQKRDGVILLIGAFKLVKGITLVALGIAALTLDRDGIVEHLRHWMAMVGVGPTRIEEAISRLTTIDPSTLREVGAGSLAYASLFFVEGYGLLRRRVWAEYVTVVITTSLVPIEVYEMIEHESVTKGIVIAVNVAAVGYLIWRLRRDNHWPFHHHVSASRPATG